MEKQTIIDMKKLVLLCLAAFLAVSCNKAETSSEGTAKEKTVDTKIPLFNADSCYTYVKRQTDFGPRVPNSEAHQACGEYLVGHFKSLGIKTTVQEAQLNAHDGTTLNAKNITAAINPEAKARIFICAHWDSRPFCDEDPDPAKRKQAVLGANDGASGVGVIMELARIMAMTPPSIGIDLILFDAEDYGDRNTSDSYCLGSQYWAKNIDTRQYKPNFGILLDMVGAEDAVFCREGVSEQYAPFVLDLIWRRAHELGYASKFINQRVGGIVDDHYFINKITNIPCIDIIHYTDEQGFPSTWHTSEDNMENISKSTLSVVGDVLTHIIYEMK